MQDTDIENTFLFNAIDNYDLYSKSQRDVLKTLIAVSIDDIASVHKNFLIEKLNLCKTTIYTILTSLENENLIIRKRLKNTRFDSIKSIELHYKRLSNFR